MSAKLSDLNIIFCTSIKIKPNPNSTADNIKKKKVRESKFKLSNTSPIINEAAYNVIHSNSAVKSKCKAVLTFIAILAMKKKKINNIIFRSPILIIYKIKKLRFLLPNVVLLGIANLGNCLLLNLEY